MDKDLAFIFCMFCIQTPHRHVYSVWVRNVLLLTVMKMNLFVHVNSWTTCTAMSTPLLLFEKNALTSYSVLLTGDNERVFECQGTSNEARDVLGTDI